MNFLKKAFSQGYSEKNNNLFILQNKLFKSMIKKSLREKLVEKGWTEEEIEHALAIMKPSEAKDSAAVIAARRVNPLLYWLTLIISIIGNFLIAVAIIPFLIVLSDIQLYFVMAILAVSFGAMFNFLINTIEHLDPQHHVVAGIFIPALSAITIFIMVNVANRLSAFFQSPIIHNPIWVVVVYVAAFSAPYFIGKIAVYILRKR